jgi:tetratricopeptide (TPR) repeat protein
MRSHSTLTGSLYGLCLILILVSLVACSPNKAEVRLPSHPNEFSTYLFSAGDVLYFSQDFGGATDLYRMSHNYDTNAFTIKRSIFNSLLARVYTSQIPVEDFAGYADTLLAENLLDKDMLEQSYNVYIQTGKLQQAKQILDVYFQSYKSARAYTSMFYLQEQLEGKKQLKLLSKARSLAGADADFLNTLGKMYAQYDSTEAAKTWVLARKYDTTAEATSHLWNYYAARRDYPALRKLYASFPLPQDQERQTATLEQTLKTGNFLSVIAMQPQIFASGQTDQTLVLLQASWYANQDKVFEQTLQKLNTLTLSKPDLQTRSVFAACWLLKTSSPEALQAIAALDGKSTLDEFLQLYRAYNDGRFDKIDNLADATTLPRLNQLLRNATSSVLAQPVRDYLIVMTDSLRTNYDYKATDALAQPCVQYFFDNDRKTYDGYLWLIEYYSRTKDLSSQVAILQEALGTFTEDAALLNWLGYSYVLQNEHLEEAESLVRRALQLSPDNPYYLDSMGWLYYLKGDYSNAIKQMAIPQKLEKLPAEIAWHIASIYLALEDHANAAVYAKRAIESNDDPIYTQKAEELLKSLP